MPRPESALPDLLRWFQAAVVAPHEPAKRRRLAPASKHILPSKTLKPEQRVGIYVDAYLARLVEALESDFEAVTTLLGHHGFHELCRSYLEKHPSTNWSLNPLGRKLPAYLATFPRRAAARDLAALEAAMSEVFDAEESAPLKPEDFGKIAPEKVAASRLVFVPTFRLLALDYAANPYVDAVRQKKPLPPLRKKKSWIAVYRKGFQVWRLDLKEPAHAALSMLMKGRTVGAALAAAAARWRGSPSGLQGQVRQWFGEWVSEGFFSAVRQPPASS